MLVQEEITNPIP